MLFFISCFIFLGGRGCFVIWRFFPKIEVLYCIERCNYLLSVQNLNLYSAIKAIAYEQWWCECTTLTVTRNIRLCGYLRRPTVELRLSLHNSKTWVYRDSGSNLNLRLARITHYQLRHRGFPIAVKYMTIFPIIEKTLLSQAKDVDKDIHKCVGKYALLYL